MSLTAPAALPEDTAYRRMSWPPALAPVFLAFAILTGSYYYWLVRATGNRFYWRNDLPGYYNYLGQAFASGHTYLPVEPRPELLALPNPWDGEKNGEFRLHDAVLYNRRYYLYHGAAPAVLFFAPWRLITGHDLPENFAIFLICFLGYLFWAGALVQVLRAADAAPGPLLLIPMLLAVGFCQSIPFLLNRIWVYEIAIATGYMCIAGGYFFLAQSLSSGRRRLCLAGSGLMFGMSIACRPHLALAAAVIFIWLAIRMRRSRLWRTDLLFAFAAPVAFCGLAVAAYNFARFGNPFEFGLHYLLAGTVYEQRIALSYKNLRPGLYYMFLSPPEFSAVFPWFRLLLRFPFNRPTYTMPRGYFIEPIAGILWLSPVVFGLLTLPFLRIVRVKPEIRGFLGAMVISALLVFLFVAGTGFTTQRYEVDFLPLMVFAAVASTGILIAHCRPLLRGLLVAALALTTLGSTVANLAIGMTGPYDDILINRPASYVKIAGWFSPSPQLRPLLNPRLRLDFVVNIAKQWPGYTEPLVHIGSQGLRYSLNLEHRAAGLHLISTTGRETLGADLPAEKSLHIEVVFDPDAHTLITSADGVPLAVHKEANIVTAPSQVWIGASRYNHALTSQRFTGSIEVRARTVEEHR